MDKKPDTPQSSPPAPPPESAPVRWVLSKKDKQFLRSCNIVPESR